MNLENAEGRPQLPHKVKEGTSTKKVGAGRGLAQMINPAQTKKIIYTKDNRIVRFNVKKQHKIPTF